MRISEKVVFAYDGPTGFFRCSASFWMSYRDELSEEVTQITIIDQGDSRWEDVICRGSLLCTEYIPDSGDSFRHFTEKPTEKLQKLAIY